MALPDLANWSAFLEQLLLTIWSQLKQYGPLAPVLVRCFLGPPGLSGPIAGTSLNSLNRRYDLSAAAHPPPQPTPPPSTFPIPLYMPLVIIQSL